MPTALRVAPLSRLSRTGKSLGAGHRSVAAGFLMGPKGFLLGAMKMLRKSTEVMVAGHGEGTKGRHVVHINVVNLMLCFYFS